MLKNFYQHLMKDINFSYSLENFESSQINNFEFVNKNLFFPMRDYKQEALFALQYFLNLSNDNYFKKELIEDIDGKKIPFLGFEIATGAGKTSMIGSNMLYLYKKGYRDFMIITPNTFIYDKTIKNFTLNDKKCIFSEEMPLKVNLITGENYKDKTCEYDDGAEITIYVFNIQKFFEKNSSSDKKQDESSGVPYTLRPLEESFWKDGAGNTIPFVDFLKKRRLIIFTDEAHHYQEEKSFETIKQLNPEMVIEYTATALETSKNKREQKIIYKYSISQLIEQKYAKTIRALGYSNIHEISSNQVSEADKRKIFLSLLCHLVKRESLKEEKVKPLMLIRARQIEHSKNIIDYLQNGLIEDELILEEVLEIIKSENSPITGVFLSIFKKMSDNKEKLLKKISEIAKLSFRIDSDIKTEAGVIEKWDNIEKNEYEIVVYVKSLDEGIDVSNIYLLTILSDNDSNVKNNIKQIIGRGVRLYKEQREFDNENNLKKQAEMLYVICYKDRNFDSFIDEIRADLELSKNQFDRDDNWNYQTVEDIPDTEKLKDIEIDCLSILQKDKEKRESILEIIKKSEEMIDLFLDKISLNENGKMMIRETPDTIIDERNISAVVSSEPITVAETEEKILKLSDKEIESIISEFILEYNVIPDHEEARKEFRKLIEKIMVKKLFYKTKFGYDETRVKSLFFKEFLVIFGNFIEKKIFDEDIEINKIKLRDIFKKRDIEIAKGKNEANWLSPNYKLSLFVDTYFTGYKYSIYKYVNFDSEPEKIVANLLEEAMEKEKDSKNFWIKNDRRGQYTITIKGRGEHQYNPDFIVFFKGQIYIIEVKGGGLYLEEFKKRRNDEKLRLLEEKTTSIKSILLMSDDIRKFSTIGGNFSLITSNNKLFQDLKNKNLSTYW